MRNKKIEEIRRIVVAAISMCDLSSLDNTKKKLKNVVLELDSIEADRSNRKNLPENHVKNFKNPIASLNAIEEEIRKESAKILSKAEANLFNE